MLRSNKLFKRGKKNFPVISFKNYTIRCYLTLCHVVKIKCGFSDVKKHSCFFFQNDILPFFVISRMILFIGNHFYGLQNGKTFFSRKKILKLFWENFVVKKKLTHISERAFSELEIESESVGAVWDFRRLSGTFEAVLGPIVDRVGERVGPVDRAVRWTHCRLAHEPFRS